MSDLIAIVYPNEEKAEQVRQRLLQLQKEYVIELEDAVIAVKTAYGRVKLNQLINPTGFAALNGSLWGLLIGAIFMLPVFGPAAGAIGAAGGAALGAATGAIVGALTDLGIDDDFIKQLADNLQPGNAALFLLVRKMTADKVLEAIKGTGGTVLRTSLDRGKEEALRAALTDATA